VHCQGFCSLKIRRLFEYKMLMVFLSVVWEMSRTISSPAITSSDVMLSKSYRLLPSSPVMGVYASQRSSLTGSYLGSNQ
jgi:hypothetical protein